MDRWQRIKWDVRRLYWQARKVLLRRKIGERWEGDGGAFERRRYPDYETYVEHQKTKLGAFRSKSVIRHDQRFHAALLERLGVLGDLRGRTALCLAARQGSEVRAFIDRGAFAVGVDLNPGPENRYVVVGDFHALQYADGSVDVVYTNSLDHAFDLDRILGEVARVLRPGGAFLVEANTAEGERAEAGPYESFVWGDVERLVDRIRERGFEVEARSSFESPWPGEQLLMRLAAR